jgi:hypothetical protein
MSVAAALRRSDPETRLNPESSSPRPEITSINQSTKHAVVRRPRHQTATKIMQEIVMTLGNETGRRESRI